MSFNGINGQVTKTLLLCLYSDYQVCCFQWGWSEMEELLQCPVCFDPPTNGIVEQCRFGHHICSACKPKVESCPLCKCNYTGTRNFVVEELMRNLEIIKVSVFTEVLNASADVKEAVIYNNAL